MNGIDLGCPFFGGLSRLGSASFTPKIMISLFFFGGVLPLSLKKTLINPLKLISIKNTSSSLQKDRESSPSRFLCRLSNLLSNDALKILKSHRRHRPLQLAYAALAPMSLWGKKDGSWSRRSWSRKQNV